MQQSVACSHSQDAETRQLKPLQQTALHQWKKVIGALKETFEMDNKGISVTYNPTGSGSGITAVAEGLCDIGLSSRDLKDEEKAMGLIGTILCLRRYRHYCKSRKSRFRPHH